MQVNCTQASKNKGSNARDPGGSLRAGGMGIRKRGFPAFTTDQYVAG
jgi:hypothetical protein